MPGPVAPAPPPPPMTYQSWLQDRNPDNIRDTNQLMSWANLTFANSLQDLIRTLAKRMETLGAKMAKAGELMKELNTGEASVADATTGFALYRNASRAAVEARQKEFLDAGTGTGLLHLNGPFPADSFSSVPYYQIYAKKEEMKTMAENLQTTITNDSSVSQQLQLLLSQLNSRFTTVMENVAKFTKNYGEIAAEVATNFRG